MGEIEAVGNDRFRATLSPFMEHNNQHQFRWYLEDGIIDHVAVGSCDHQRGDRRPDTTRDDFPPNVSLPGSTKVVAVLSAVLALRATRRSPRIAVVIIIVAIARPRSEFALKEIYGRDRPLAVTPAPIGNAQQLTATAA